MASASTTQQRQLDAECPAQRRGRARLGACTWAASGRGQAWGPAGQLATAGTVAGQAAGGAVHRATERLGGFPRRAAAAQPALQVEALLVGDQRVHGVAAVAGQAVPGCGSMERTSRSAVGSDAHRQATRAGSRARPGRWWAVDARHGAGWGEAAIDALCAGQCGVRPAVSARGQGVAAPVQEARTQGRRGRAAAHDQPTCMHKPAKAGVLHQVLRKKGAHAQRRSSVVPLEVGADSLRGVAELSRVRRPGQQRPA